MTQESLKKAEALGINTEGLSQSQLNKAIEKAEKAAKNVQDAMDLLKSKAKEFGIDTDGISSEDLTLEIEKTEAEIELQKELDLFNEKATLLAAFFGIEDLGAISIEKLKEFLDEKTAQVLEMSKALEHAKLLEVNSEEVIDDGKSSEKFRVGDVEYEFEENTPGSFRYLGKLQSQKEWLKDTAALELMVSTKLPYVKPANK